MSTGSEPTARMPSVGDQERVATLINQVADELLQTLQKNAQYPDLPNELSFSFLKGIEAKALTEAERESLKQEQAADRRLTAMLDQLVNAVESRKAKLLRKGEAMFSLLPKPGIKSFAEERSRDSGKSFGKATRELSTARALAAVPAAQDSLDQGTISTGHVEVLARALATDKRNGSKELTPDEQAYVTGLAEGRTESDYNAVLTQFLAGRNPLAADAGLDEARRRRFFNISYTPQGAHFKGFIDAVSAQSLRTALDAASDRPDADDQRTLTQRSADALVKLAETVLDGGSLKTGANVRPHVSLVMTESTFIQASKELARRKKLALLQSQLRNSSQHQPDATASSSSPTSDINPGTTAGSDVPNSSGATTGNASDSASNGPEQPFDPALLEPIPMEPAEYLDGNPVPLTELERILCDCEITRTVLNAEGLIMNLGRTTRLYTKEHRHAIIARDRTCRFQGCTSLPSRAEIHHIDWWERDDGETSLENGVLVCKRHHTEIHEGALEVIKDGFGLPSIVVTGSPSASVPNQPRALSAFPDPPQVTSPAKQRLVTQSSQGSDPCAPPTITQGLDRSDLCVPPTAIQGSEDADSGAPLAVTQNLGPADQVRSDLIPGNSSRLRTKYPRNQNQPHPSGQRDNFHPSSTRRRDSGAGASGKAAKREPATLFDS